MLSMRSQRLEQQQRRSALGSHGRGFVGGENLAKSKKKPRSHDITQEEAEAPEAWQAMVVGIAELCRGLAAEVARGGLEPEVC